MNKKTEDRKYNYTVEDDILAEKSVDGDFYER